MQAATRDLDSGRAKLAGVPNSPEIFRTWDTSCGTVVSLPRVPVLRDPCVAVSAVAFVSCSFEGFEQVSCSFHGTETM